MVVITEGAALPHMSAFIDMYLGCFMKTRRREKNVKIFCTSVLCWNRGRSNADKENAAQNNAPKKSRHIRERLFGDDVSPRRKSGNSPIKHAAALGRVLGTLSMQRPKLSQRHRSI
jgi:hypothetical protein